MCTSIYPTRLRKTYTVGQATPCKHVFNKSGQFKYTKTRTLLSLVLSGFKVVVFQFYKQQETWKTFMCFLNSIQRQTSLQLFIPTSIFKWLIFFTVLLNIADLNAIQRQICLMVGLNPSQKHKVFQLVWTSNCQSDQHYLRLYMKPQLTDRNVW